MFKVNNKDSGIALFIFTLLCGTSKRFMNTVKAFIKFFDVSKRSVKIKI